MKKGASATMMYAYLLTPTKYWKSVSPCRLIDVSSEAIRVKGLNWQNLSSSIGCSKTISKEYRFISRVLTDHYSNREALRYQQKRYPKNTCLRYLSREGSPPFQSQRGLRTVPGPGTRDLPGFSETSPYETRIKFNKVLTEPDVKADDSSSPDGSSRSAKAPLDKRPPPPQVPPPAAGKRKSQGIDYTTLVAAVAEVVAQGWVPSKIEQVVMYDKHSVALRLRNLTGISWLHFNWSAAGGARVCLGPEPERWGAAAEAYSLAAHLSSHLNGKVLQSIRLPVPWERVVEVRVGERPLGNSRTGAAAATNVLLICEAMGKHSNLLLVSAADRNVLTTAHQVGDAMSRVRQIRLGHPYTPPPPAAGTDPDAFALSPDGFVPWIRRIQESLVAAESSSSSSLFVENENNNVTPSASSPRGNDTRGPRELLIALGRREMRVSDDGVAPFAVPATPARLGLESVKARDIADVLVKTFRGVSPALADELLERSRRQAGASASDTPRGGADTASGPDGGAAFGGNEAVARPDDTDADAGDTQALSEQAWRNLHEEWCRWLRRIAAADFEPVLDQRSGRFSVLGGAGAVSLGPAGVAGEPGDCTGFAYARFASVADMLRQVYGDEEVSARRADQHRRMTSAVAAVLKKSRGKVRSFQLQLERAGTAGDALSAERRTADLLVANLYRIPKGATSVQVEDWDECVEDADGSAVPRLVTIKLPDARDMSPSEYAETLFKKLRKSRRAEVAVTPLLEKVEQEVAYLESIEEAIRGLGPGPNAGSTARDKDLEASWRALMKIQDELVAAGFMKPPSDAEPAAKAMRDGRRRAARQTKISERTAGNDGGRGRAVDSDASSTRNSDPFHADSNLAATEGFRIYRSPGGFPVLAGRNNRQNDFLTTKVARDSDLWFHVRDMPGSHVVLRISPGQEPPGEADVSFAADVAAFHSRAGQSNRADVMMTRPAWVKKGKGMKPGQVQVSRELGGVTGRPQRCPGAEEEAGAAGQAK